MLVDVRVILFVENDRMNEYLCPRIELETPRVYEIGRASCRERV